VRRAAERIGARASIPPAPRAPPRERSKTEHRRLNTPAQLKRILHASRPPAGTKFFIHNTGTVRAQV
jgi:hypothetical protein